MKSTSATRAKRIALAILALSAADAGAQSTPPVQLNLRPETPRVGEPIGVTFSCPNVGGLDRIDERRTRVRMLNGVIRMELFTKPDESFGFCDQFVRLGWLPEGTYALELWFDGVLSGQRSFSVAPPDPIPEGQRGPAYNFTGIYTNPNKPGRNASVIQSVSSSSLAVILTGYDVDRSTTNWLLICERWVLPKQCIGTVYTSDGDPYTSLSDLTSASLRPIGPGRFVDQSVNNFVGMTIFMTIGGVEYGDLFVPLRY